MEPLPLCLSTSEGKVLETAASDKPTHSCHTVQSAGLQVHQLPETRNSGAVDQFGLAHKAQEPGSSNTRWDGLVSQWNPELLIIWSQAASGSAWGQECVLASFSHPETPLLPAPHPCLYLSSRFHPGLLDHSTLTTETFTINHTVETSSTL